MGLFNIKIQISTEWFITAMSLKAILLSCLCSILCRCYNVMNIMFQFFFFRFFVVVWLNIFYMETYYQFEMFRLWIVGIWLLNWFTAKYIPLRSEKQFDGIIVDANDSNYLPRIASKWPRIFFLYFVEMNPFFERL